MGKVYELAREFKRKYPSTVAWRIKAHSKVIEKHLNPDEEVLYVFLGQKNKSSFDFTNTNVIALTNKRLLFATKRVMFGYFFTSVTPDMFNDLTVKMGLIWGKIYIDTIKEFVKFSNIQREALPEIETAITSYMMEAKKDYQKSE